MEYAVLGLAVALISVKFWLDERREKRWHKLLNDMLNRKMAKDFYDYVNATELLERAQNPHVKTLEEIEQQIQDKRDAGSVPPFINQKKAPIPIAVKEY